MLGRSTLRAAGAAILLALGISSSIGAAAPAAAAPATAATTTASPTPTTTGLAYVALGDSYAAGYGLSHLTKQPVAACDQSGLDYPHRIAAALGLRLTDVTCAGATTANVIDTKQNGAAPQIDALSARTRLVTISIGGNDSGLFSTAQSCIALSKNGPIFGASSSTTTCKSEFVTKGHDALTSAIETKTAKGLAATFRAIKHRAPNAAVVVIGYPAVFPDRANTPKSGCYRPLVDSESLADGFPKDAFPFTATDVAYLHGVQVVLDRVTAEQAAKAGVTYVSTLAGSEAHSGCATTGSYISGISLTASEYFKSISLQTGALHPNSRGVAYLTSQATPAVEKALTPTASPTPTASAGSHQGAGAGFRGLVWIVALAALVAAFVVLLAVFRRRRAARTDTGGSDIGDSDAGA
ncbi:SGNH/GDSL hydrolase family protein [Frondihabitans australicus]|uniref:GDSL-like lipase/acylhydrolase family protein n=1 Tax=Frondihabitans australicus TaxID=386892 RepID=A0A495IHU1_9MICO|nr:SGNH/GDSL hydrolase family protein [Frondihabitans australicus]RKR74685.1 GDSL-like lipase/acylhydrolase family protein [Frondihabitans australicus]